jgi:hypothetical protein
MNGLTAALASSINLPARLFSSCRNRAAHGNWSVHVIAAPVVPYENSFHPPIALDELPNDLS